MLDARNKPCPQPVVMALNELKKIKESESLEILTNNAESVENLKRLAARRNRRADVKEQDGDYLVTICPYNDLASEEDNGDCQICRDAEEIINKADIHKKTVVIIGTDRMGSGDDALGDILIKSFIFSLTQLESLPDAVIFFNGGARLTTEGSASLEDIRNLSSLGVTILTCGTCLDFLGLKDKLEVGGVTNMYEIAERMLTADNTVRI